MRLLAAFTVAVVIAGSVGTSESSSTELLAAAAASGSCESLAALALPHARIDSTQRVAAGEFVAPGGAGRGAAAAVATAAFAKAPAFCRVSATLTPSADSDIKAEVWQSPSQGRKSRRPSHRRRLPDTSRSNPMPAARLRP